MKHTDRIISIAVVVVLIITCCASPVFADPITLSGAEFFMSLWGSYAAAHGLELEFSQNDINSSVSNPFSVQSFREAGADLYDEFAEYSSSIYSDAEEFYEAYRDEVTVTTNINNQVIMNWSDMLTEWYDEFATWLMSVKYGLSHTESGYAHSSGSFDSPLISYSAGWPIYSSSMTIPQVFAIGKLYGSGSTSIYNGAVNDRSVFLYALNENNNYYPEVISNINSGIGIVTNGSYQNNSSASISTIYNNTTYYYSNQHGLYFDLNQLAPYVMIFTSIGDAIEYYDEHFFNGIVSSSEKIELRPKDKYNEDPVANPIPIPDTTDAGYLPVPQDYVLNPSYVGSLPSDIEALIYSLTDALTENVSPIVDEAVDPNPPVTTPIEIPFLGFTLPSFNLGLSGIWHYVTDWVSSLGSGLSFFASIWSNIPFVMILPVYATAVIVIVVGMLKRFLL